MTNGPKAQPEATAAHEGGEHAVPRRPYHAPQLRRLGSVRELTLGATQGMSEGGGTFFAPMM